MSDEGVQQAPDSPAAGKGSAIDDAAMEDLIDKLKILRYDTEFCQSVKPPFKPLSKCYFTGPSSIDNPNTQFYYFTSLCSWLFELCGHTFEKPAQFDDPTATSTNIIAELRSLNISIPNLAPNRIRQGSGEAVLTILAALTDEALRKANFGFRPIDYSAVETYDEADGGADADEEANAEEIEDNIVIDSDDEDDVYVRGAAGAGGDEENAVQDTAVNAEEWNLEVERVGPLLQVRSESGIEDWRSRLEDVKVLLKATDKMYPEVKHMLDRMRDDLEKAQDRIQKREQTLTQQFSEQVEDYRVKLHELNTSQDAANLESQTVQQLSVELNQVSELLDHTKQEVEEREQLISDTAPLMQIKEAVAKVRGEIKQMALRSGILQHTVMHYIMRQAKAQRDGSDDVDLDYADMDDGMEAAYD